MTKSVKIAADIIQKRMEKRIPLSVWRVSDKSELARLRADVADSKKACAQGLAGVRTVPEGYGMLFPTPGPFWMRGVNVPLDVGFLDKQGSILDIRTMKPVDFPDNMMPRYSCRRPGCESAIEVAAGWFDKRGVKVGDKIAIAKEEKKDAGTKEIGT